MRSVADAVVDVIVEHRVTHVFGLLGEGNLELAYLADSRPDLQWTAMRREDAVVCAADGYAQGSGRVGVGMVTHGPALANTLTGLIGAVKGRTPLVVLCGELTDQERAHPQWVDQSTLLTGTGVEYRRVHDPTAAEADVGAAFHDAEAWRRPVVVGIPVGTQRSEATGGTYVPADRRHTGEPGGDAIAELAARLCAARRPVLLAGRGAVRAREALCALAERTGCLLTTTLLAKGLFDGEPFDIGVCGGFSTPSTQRLVVDADLVVAFGAGLDPYTSMSGALLQAATIAQVDVDPEAVGRHLVPDVSVVGDCADVATRLVDAVPEARVGYRSPELRDGVRADDGAEDLTYASGAEGLDPRSVAVLLDRALPKDRALAVDLGYFTSEPATYVRIDSPAKLGFPLHFGSIGLGLATAIGLSCAHPRVPVVCAVGDGGLAASVGELDTLSRSGLPIVVAVFDDEAYGVEYQALRGQGRPTELSRFAPVDLAAVARGYGIEATTVRTVDEFTAVGAMLAEPKRPLLIDFKIDPRIVTRWYRDLVRTHPPDKGG